MTININNASTFAPANNGNGTILEVAVKAKELAEVEGEMALQLIDSAAPSEAAVGNTGHNVNIKV